MAAHTADDLSTDKQTEDAATKGKLWAGGVRSWARVKYRYLVYSIILLTTFLEMNSR